MTQQKKGTYVIRAAFVKLQAQKKRLEQDIELILRADRPTIEKYVKLIKQNNLLHDLMLEWAKGQPEQIEFQKPIIYGPIKKKRK